MQDKVPPFYENWDNTHCAQCVLRGILEYFEPEKSWTWKELDQFTGKQPDKWTWPYCTYLNMIERGYDIININPSDLKDYIEMGLYEAMVKNLGKEAADKNREHSDLEKESDNLIEYYDLTQKGIAKREQRLATLADLRSLLEKGYLVSSSLNWRKLYDQEGFGSHLVLVYAVDDQYVYFHDSGLPPKPEQKIFIEKFIEASTSPTPNQWVVTAYKKL